MPVIHVLDSETIDKIAAGEVVERPSSVVKELVENAIDAGATAVTVEAKDGGIRMVRVTDNGCGMEREQLRKAFLRHATSKIENAEDLNRIHSLGFRGEALSSIAAVSRVEIITKPADSLTGTRMILEGGEEKSFEEIGAPDGTTFVMSNLFYNTPVRRKFLKTASTEGGYITDLCEHLALSRPDVSFKLIIGNQVRFHTSGNGDLKEVIYRIYGREIANALVPVEGKHNGMELSGYVGKPVIVRSNRNFEIYYMNGRFIRSTVIARAIEEGYKEYLMQHKFPFCVLHFTMDPELVDVNVHPTKMDVRFRDNYSVSEFLSQTIAEALQSREVLTPQRLIGERELRTERRQELQESRQQKTPEPFESARIRAGAVQERALYEREVPEREKFAGSPVWERIRRGQQEKTSEAEVKTEGEAAESEEFFTETDETGGAEPMAALQGSVAEEPYGEKSMAEFSREDSQQLTLFENRLLSPENHDNFRLIGQVFDTYWMFQYQDKLCILDQHAAHEKVKYERFMKRYQEKEVISQMLCPPIIVSLSGREEAVLRECGEAFRNLGFEIESFGGSEYTVRSVPVELYGCSEREMFLEVLDEMEAEVAGRNPRVVEERIASMACKAAVKGNNSLSFPEAQELIRELLTLDNPYNCPHGRPTIITISQYEMEKKFKRIVN